MIVIKTMTNLPEHCYDCPCHDGESGYCQADKERRNSYYRPFWCPLVAKPNQSKTVLYSSDGYADGYMVYDMAECPNCGYEYEDGDKDWGLPFCPNCGQSLNWESEVKE